MKLKPNCFIGQLILVLSMLFLVYNSYSQKNEVFDSTLFDSPYVVIHQLYFKDAYSNVLQDDAFLSNPTINKESFNKGLIHDPLLLVQGQLAGIQIYNRNGNPNQNSIIRIRGLSGFSETKPLYVIDGVPGLYLDSVDPNDIESMTFLKNGGAQAIYGSRASNGVVLVETKKSHFSTDTFLVNYKGQTGVSIPDLDFGLLGTEEFKANGGYDFGSSNNWMNLISQNGISQNHHLTFKGKQKSTSYRIAGSSRDVNGVLKNTGFQQVNVRAYINQMFLENRLKLSFSGGYHNRNSNLGFNEVIQIAKAYNPTAPVFSGDAPFTFDNDRFGGYYENIGLFGSYNPVALIDQNNHDREQDILSLSAHLEYSLNERLNLNFRYASQDDWTTYRTYFSPMSYFGGNANSPRDSLKGKAFLNDTNKRTNVYEAFINSRLLDDDVAIFDLMLGTGYQNGAVHDQAIELNGLGDPGLVQVDRIGILEDWDDKASGFDSLQYGWNEKLISVFGRANFGFNGWLFVNSSVRYDGSSKLGTNKQWGLYSSTNITLDFLNILSWHELDVFTFRLGYGVTGNLPRNGGLSQSKFIRRIDENGNESIDKSFSENQRLGSEKKKEWNIGVDLVKDKFAGSIDFYTRRVSDFIKVTSDVNSFIYSNTSGIQSTGLDLALKVNCLEGVGLSYDQQFNFSYFKSKYEIDGEVPVFVNFIDGGRNHPPILVGDGIRIGTIRGPVFTGEVDDSGGPLFEDVNGDQLVIIGNDIGPEIDYDDLGNAIPSFEFGWSHQLRYKDWSVFALFRGALGHVLVNRDRQALEPQLFSNNLFNQVRTALTIEELGSSLFSSHWVEKASFVKMDNLTISKRFKFNRKRNIQLELSLTAQNLITATKYTGQNPEPVLEGADPRISTFNSEFNRNVNLQTLGMDRQASYINSKTFVLGANLAF